MDQRFQQRKNELNDQELELMRQVIEIMRQGKRPIDHDFWMKANLATRLKISDILGDYLYQ